MLPSLSSFRADSTDWSSTERAAGPAHPPSPAGAYLWLRVFDRELRVSEVWRVHQKVSWQLGTCVHFERWIRVSEVWYVPQKWTGERLRG